MRRLWPNEGEIALARLRYREAAGHFANAAADVTQTEDYLDAQLNYLSKEAAALYKQGDEFGDNASLLLSIERNRSLLERQARARFPARLGLGAEQSGQCTRDAWPAGTREGAARGGGHRLRGRPGEPTRERVPVGWAITQNNRASHSLRLASVRIAQSSSRRPFRPTGRTQRVPRERFSHWARTQSNLGNTLQKLGSGKAGQGGSRRR